MDEQTIINTLAENGGKLWEKNGMRRIYFNPEVAMSLDINRYNTGNISSATANCSAWDRPTKISNSEAYRALNCKFWYDLTDGKFHWKNTDQLHGDCRIAYTTFFEDLRLVLNNLELQEA